MSTNQTVDALLTVLAHWGETGQLKKATASAMRSACERVLGILDGDARKDVAQVDVDDVIKRFHNLNPDVTPVSLRTYKSRIKNAIEMFVAYRKDPVKWKPGIKSRAPRKNRSGAAAATKNGESLATTKSGSKAGTASAGSSVATLTIPFNLRPEVTVTISGIPRDLNTHECERLVAFLRPLAVDYKD